MSERFNSGFDYIRFSEIVRDGYRFAYPKHVTKFLKSLVETSGHRARDVPTGNTLWRAQLGCEITEREEGDSELTYIVQDEIPYEAKRMKPLPRAAHEGRANPKGIPCLYLATDQDTAMSEVRPWVGAAISLARFSTTRDLRLVDLTIGHDFQLTPDHLFGLVSPEEMEKAAWAQVDKAFSQPVSDSQSMTGLSTAEYAPTQVIAEYLRQAKYDGLIYRSHLGPGMNVALYDLECATVTSTSLKVATKVSYDFGDRR
jgi:RES domain